MDKNTFISWSVALWFPSSRIQGQLVTVHSLAGLTSAAASSWGPSSHRRSPSLSACYTFLLWGFYCQGNGGSGGKVPPQDRPSRFRGRSVRPMRPLEDQTRSTVKAGKTSFFRGHSVMASWKDKCFWWAWTWLTNEPRGSHDFRQSRLWDSCVLCGPCGSGLDAGRWVRTAARPCAAHRGAYMWWEVIVVSPQSRSHTPFLSRSDEGHSTDEASESPPE